MARGAGVKAQACISRRARSQGRRAVCGPEYLVGGHPLWPVHDVTPLPAACRAGWRATPLYMPRIVACHAPRDMQHETTIR